jgi:chromosome segregation ATPase
MLWNLFSCCSCLIVNLCLQMRLNKVSELIHNSSNHQNLDSAGVSVHFQEIVDSVPFLFDLVLLFMYRMK